MAKVKYGGGVLDMRNALAGQVHSRNTYGNYIRQKVSPVQPRTSHQVKLRNQLTQLSKRYSTELTDAQREAWIAFASDNPVTDVFGDSIVLTGINFYQKVNNLRLLMELTILDDPPSDYTVTDLTSASLNITNTPPLKIEVVFAPAPAPAKHRVEVWATEPVSPGTLFYGPKMRLLMISQANTNSPLDITQSYTDRFGTPPIGKKIAAWIRLVNEDNGAQSRGVVTSAVVPEAGGGGP